MGKGDWRRPSRVSDEELEDRWNRIFKKKPQQGPGKSQDGTDNEVTLPGDKGEADEGVHES